MIISNQIITTEKESIFKTAKKIFKFQLGNINNNYRTGEIINKFISLSLILQIEISQINYKVIVIDLLINIAIQ